MKGNEIMKTRSKHFGQFKYKKRRYDQRKTNCNYIECLQN